MTNKNGISRRAFLMGAGGVMIGLPVSRFAMRNGKIFEAYAQSSGPMKLITIFLGNSLAQGQWDFGKCFATIPQYHNRLLILDNAINSASQKTLFAFGENHAAAGITTFVGSPTASRSQSGGISLDQQYSQLKGAGLIFPNLSLGCGIARTYHTEAAWTTRSYDAHGNPNSPIQQPSMLFDKLFHHLNFNKQSVANEGIKRREIRSSVLDAIMSSYREAKSDRTGLSFEGKRLLDEHLSKIRSTEIAIQDFGLEHWDSLISKLGTRPANFADLNGEILRGEDWAQVFAIQSRLIAYAFSTGLTISVSCNLGGAASSVQFPTIGNGMDEHTFSHFGGTPPNDAYKNYLMQGKQHRMTMIAGLLNELNNAGILNDTLIVGATEFSDGNIHTNNVQPHFVIGDPAKIKGGQRIDSGFFTSSVADVYASGSQFSVNDIYRSCLDVLGAPVANFGTVAYNSNRSFTIRKT